LAKWLRKFCSKKTKRLEAHSINTGCEEEFLILRLLKMEEKSENSGVNGVQSAASSMDKFKSLMIGQKTRRLYGMPCGGDWYYQQKTALAAAIEKYGLKSGFVGGWQKPGTKAFCYGVYENYNALMSDMQSIEPAKRYGYEIIRADVPCHLFFDIEWVSEKVDSDVEHAFLGRLVKVLHQVFETRFGRSPVLCTTCDTRVLKDGSNKNSFHLLEQSVVFENGHGNLMKLVVHEVLELLSAEDHTCVDKGVYTRNRSMRTPLSSKRESNSPGFKNVSGDTSSLIMATFIHEREIPDDDPIGYDGFAISCPHTEHSSPNFEKNPLEQTQDKNKASLKASQKRSRFNSKKGKESTETLFVGVKEVESMLKKMAIDLCRIHIKGGAEYAEWMSVLFGVHAFSCIRSSYRGTFDVEARYSAIVTRDEAEFRVSIKTIKQLARDAPALVLASQPTVVEYDELQGAMDAVWEGDARKKIDNHRALRRNMLGLLMNHTDKKKRIGNGLCSYVRLWWARANQSTQTLLKNILCKNTKKLALSLTRMNWRVCGTPASQIFVGGQSCRMLVRSY